MAELREDKKRKILDFLEENAEANESLVALEVDQVIEEFADETFDEETIEDLVDELEEDDLIKQKTAKLDIVYPSGYKESIEEEFDHLFDSSPIFASYFIGTAISLFMFDSSGPAFQYIFGDAVGNPTTIAIRGILFGVLGAYGIGRVIIRGYNVAQENLKILQDQKQLIVPIVTIGSIAGAIAVAFTTYTSQPLTTSHLIQIISISVAGGVAISKFLTDDG
ncbi:Rossmann-fold NAD(P)-binding domain-containing protein [Halorussus ruber]|uniref:hypothetical protein n=1 Tax=Halorussus ruber TaxID=1126238 RepID=UPI0010930DE7|nr:hypothetical protein [Halorussus ruber]